MAAVADPLGGSYFVETLTDQIEAAAWRVHRARSTRWAASCARSRRATRSARSPRSAYRRSSARSTAASASIVGVNKYVTPRRGRPHPDAEDRARRPSTSQIERVQGVPRPARRAPRPSARSPRCSAALARRQPERDAADLRRGEGARDARRDLRSVPQRARRVPRPGVSLDQAVDAQQLDLGGRDAAQLAVDQDQRGRGVRRDARDRRSRCRRRRAACGCRRARGRAPRRCVQSPSSCTHFAWPLCPAIWTGRAAACADRSARGRALIEGRAGRRVRRPVIEQPATLAPPPPATWSGASDSGGDAAPPARARRDAR